MREERRHPNCLNCGHPTPGPYCGNCGQRNADLHASFWALATDLLGEAFEADSRIGRTILPFLFRPGFLTNEHNAGRRVRYSSPLRLYLFCSFAYFLALSLTGAGAPGIRGEKGGVRISYSFDETDGGVRDRPDGGSDHHVTGLGPLNQRVEDRLREVTSMKDENRAQFGHRLQGEFIGYLPKVLFVLLPVFALLLKLFFWRTRRFYVEHLTFAFHVHALAFFVLLLQLGFVTAGGHSRASTGLAFLLIGIYALLALRAAYQQRWGWTVAKFLGLAFVYSVLVAFGIGLAAVIGFMTA